MNGPMGGADPLVAPGKVRPGPAPQAGRSWYRQLRHFAATLASADSWSRKETMATLCAVRYIDPLPQAPEELV
jgi:hypothetical protein